jgi:hypothetical protein
MLNIESRSAYKSDLSARRLIRKTISVGVGHALQHYTVRRSVKPSHGKREDIKRCAHSSNKNASVQSLPTFLTNELTMVIRGQKAVYL